MNSLSWTANLGLVLILLTGAASAQKKIDCSDGQHIAIDIKQVSMQYDGSSFAGTLSSLSVLSARLEIAPKKLQEAAAATQQWDVFLKGLVAGYNNCVITRQQYADGLNRIYPRLKEDAISLEQMRKLISDGRKTDARRLSMIVDSFYADLKQFAGVSGQSIVLGRIEALSEQLTGGQNQILRQEQANSDRISAKLDALIDLEKKSPLPSPAEVAQKISSTRKDLLARADEAEASYNKGYDLLNRYRFKDAIPYLEKAVADVPLPEFSQALGYAYTESGNLNEAEKVLRKGLDPLEDDVHKARLASQLAATLSAKGDIENALRFGQQALKIDEKIYGLEHPVVADDADKLGHILLAKGDLDGALQYTQRAFNIDEKILGTGNVAIANVMDDLGRILLKKGELNQALVYSQRALNLNEKAFPYLTPRIADATNHIGLILLEKGDDDKAMEYLLRAIDIDKKVYGPDHRSIAANSTAIGEILLHKGDLNGAMEYTRRALDIDKKMYGPDHFTVAADLNNIGQILQAKGDLEGALQYTKSALDIDEKVYGIGNPTVATRLNNLGEILQQLGNLDGALEYTKRALDIDEEIYGPNNSAVGTIAANIAEILKLKGNPSEALQYNQRALKIYEQVYGPDDKRTKWQANELEKTRQLTPK